MRAGTWSTFVRRFEPIEQPDGQIIRDTFDTITTNEHFLWTVLDCDGKLYLSAGLRYVNRIGYVICKKPWTTADEDRDYVY